MPIEPFLTQHGETLLYLGFFTPLALLAALEIYAPARPGADRHRRWPSNIALTALNIVALGALPVSAVGIALWAEGAGFGLLNQVEWSWWAALAVGFAGRSLVAYGIHRAMHQVPILWRVHRVHHLDTALDVTTTVRFHPLEFVIQMVPGLAAVALLGLPVWVIIAYEIVDAFIAVATHANLRLPARLERIVRWVFVTPDVHRIHHSARQLETDSNYGALFTCWDRLFGSFVPAPTGGHKGMTIGLEDWRDARANGFFWLLASPVFSPPGQGAPAHQAS